MTTSVFRHFSYKKSPAPALTVVMPAYNAAAEVTGSIRSVLGQSFHDLELLVVDDGSTDSTASTVRELARHDKRIRLLEGSHRGPSAARNMGVAAARGEFLTFVDADDRVLPGAYELMVTTLRRTGSSLVSGGYVRRGSVGSARPRRVQRVHQATRTGVVLTDIPELLNEPVLWNKVYRTDFWRSDVGEIPERVNYEDQEPVYRAFLHAPALDVLAEDVYAWTLSDGRSTRSSKKHRTRELRARFEVIDALRKLVEGTDSAVQLQAYALWLQDLAMHAELVPLRPKKYWRVLHTSTARLTEGMPESVWLLVPAQDRYLMWAVARGSLEDVEEILGSRLEETTAVPLVSTVEGWYAQAPYLTRVETPPPRNLQAAQECDLSAVAEVSELEWQSANGVALSGAAYVRGVDPDQVRTQLVARHNGVTVARAKVKRISAPQMDLRSNDPWITYRDSGFLGRLVLPDVPDGDSLEIGVELTVGPFTAYTPLEVRNLHSIAGTSPTETGRKWLVRTDSHSCLHVSQRRSSMVKAVALFTGGDVVAVDTLDSRLAPQRLLVSRGVSTAELSRVRGLPGIVRFAGRLPPQSSPREEIWAVWCEDAEGNLLPVEASAALSRTVTGDQLRASSTPEGMLILQRRPVRVTAERIELEDDFFIVHGNIDPPHEDVGILLTTSNRKISPVSFTQSTDGTFEARFTVVSRADPNSLRTILPRGGYFLKWRSAGQTHCEWVRAAGTLALKPFTAVSEWIRVAAGAQKDGSVSVVVSSPLDDVESSRFGQFTLRRTEFGRTVPAVLFESFNGKSSAGNTRAIYDAMRTKGWDIPCYWSVQDRSVPPPPGTTPVVVGSAEWHRALATSRVWVNDNNFPYFVQKRPDQYFLQTWHGTPIKKLLWDLPRRKAPLTYRRLMRRQVPQWDLMLAQDAQAGRDLRSGLDFNCDLLLMEQPRNGRLLAGQDGRARIRRLLGIHEDERVILYAPTWRNVHRQGKRMSWDDYMDVEALAQATNSYVLVRAHHVTQSAGVTAKLGPRVRDVSSYPHVEDLMLAADVLVTDYSSLVFDFELTGRPVVHYAPDIEHYKRERGFYRDWPDSSRWPVTTTSHALVLAVTDALKGHPVVPDISWGNTYNQQMSHFITRLLAIATMR